MIKERTLKLVLPDKIKLSGDDNLDLIILNYLAEYIIKIHKVDFKSYSYQLRTNLFNSIEIDIVLSEKSKNLSTDQFLESCEIFYQAVGNWGNLIPKRDWFELYEAELEDDFNENDDEETEKQEPSIITNPCYGRIVEGLNREEKKLTDLNLTWNNGDPFLFSTLSFCADFVTYGLQYLPEIRTEFECQVRYYEYDYDTIIPYLELDFGQFVYENEFHYARRNANILLNYLESKIKFENLRVF